MANGFTNPFTNPRGFFSSGEGGFFAPPKREGFGGFLSDPRLSIGMAIAQGQPIGRALLGGAIQAKQIEESFFPDADERKTVKGADGYNYYVDTGERVLPDVQAPTEFKSTKEVFSPKLGMNILATEERIANENLLPAISADELVDLNKAKFAKKVGDVGFDAAITEDPELFINAFGNQAFSLLEPKVDTFNPTRILSKTDIEQANKAGYNFGTEGITEIEFKPGTDVSLPITELLDPKNSFIKDLSINGTKSTNIYTGKVPVKQSEAASVAYSQSLDALESSISLFDDLQVMGPGVTGVAGKIQREVSGFFGAVGLPEYQDSINEYFSGISAEDQRNFQTKSIKFVSENLAEMTGDNSGRYSDKERQIVDDALNVLKTFSSFDQAVGAVKAVAEMNIVSADRNSFVANAGNPEFKPTLIFDAELYGITKDEAEKSQEQFSKQLMKFGFSEQDTFDILLDIKRSRTISGLFGGI